jgi:nucleoside phosphorylase
MGVFRSRGPLSLLLYVAAREGRLVWRDEHSYAVLEAPAAGPSPRRLGYVPWPLRLLDRQWDTVLFGAPPALAMATAVALLPLRQLWTVLLPGLAALYVTVLMITQALYGGWSMLRRVAGRGPDPVPDDVRSRAWSLRFCHQQDPVGAEELLALAVQRLERLIVAQAAGSVAGVGALADKVISTERLFCLLDGVTTAPAREAVRRAAEMPSPAPSVAVIAGTADPDRPLRRPEDSGRFVFVYLVGVVLGVLGLAFAVADLERDACATTQCPGRPTSYPLALRWLLQRLLLTDPDGLAPATTEAWLLGWEVSIMSLMLLPVAGVALRQHWRARDQARRQLDDLLRPTTVLILVATPVERAAVIEAAHDAGANRLDARFPGPDAVLRLGSVGGVSILLAQCEQGALAPGGSTLTSRSLIATVDYVILTGVCYGLWEDEHRLGDVLVGARLSVVDHRRVTDEVTESGAVATRAFSRGDRVSAPAALVQRCHLAAATWQSPAAVHVGLLLSGSVLLDSEELRSQYKAAEPDAMGGEMEGAGVYAAAAAAKKDWIVIKAISDWGFRKEGPDHSQQRRVAAANAARFVLHLLRSAPPGGPTGVITPHDRGVDPGPDPRH